MGRLILVLLGAFSILASAKPSNDSCSSNTTGYAQTIYNTMSFSEVELISRNHAVGLHREANIHLEPWISVGPRAWLGLDQDGRAIQIVELGDRENREAPDRRTVGYVLSGERKLKELFLRHPNELVAIDSDGQLLGFQWSQWQKGNLKNILKTSAIMGATGVCSGGFLVWLHSYITGTPIDSFEHAMTFGAVSVTSAFLQMFVSAIKWGNHNDLTDGFQPLGSEIFNVRQSDYVRDADGEITDYTIRAGRNNVSLNEVLAASNAQPAMDSGFEYNCEHELLPRGIPTRQYTPQYERR